MPPPIAWAPAAAAALAPISVTLVLWADGALSARAAVALLLAILVSAAGVGVWLARDIAQVAAVLRQAMRGEDAPARPPWFGPMAAVARGIERLARSLANRAGQVERMFRATETIVERLPDPLLVLGADRAVLRANAAARADYGADIPAVLRHPVLREAIELAWRDASAQAVDLRLPVPVERDLRAAVIWLDPPLADGGQALVVLSDRTREKMVERMRADFVANASHELRTPLSSLIGFIDTLRGPAADDPPAQARFLAIMAEQADRMARLIDDLLSLSRVEIIEHQAPAETLDLREVVTRVVAAFEPRVVARGVRVEVDMADALPDVVADADQMTQLLTNLVDNAVKYGREGGVVRVSLAVAEPGGRFPARPGVLLRVRDDGPGIAKAHLPRLTERFYRVDRARSRNTGGTGLGLAIVKHIVNRHRGVLVVDSEVGVGTVFGVWLPVEA